MEGSIKNYTTSWPSMNATAETVIDNKPNVFILVLSALYGAVCLLSLIGNSIICAVIINRGVQKSNIYKLLLNLSLADLLITVTMPFYVASTLMGHFIFGMLMCKLTFGLSHLGLRVSMLILALISYDRYRALVGKRWQGMSSFTINLLILLIWLISIGVVIPQWMHLIVNTFDGLDYCQEDWPIDTYRTTYIICLFVILSVIPLIFIVVCHAKIATHFNKLIEDQTLQAAATHRQRVIKMLALVAVFFILCYFPYQIFYVIVLFPNIGIDYRSAVFVAAILRFIINMHSCVNPIIYGLFSTKMRDDIKRLTIKSARSSTQLSLSKASFDSRFSKSSSTFPLGKKKPTLTDL
ncbi:Neuropeptide Y receptor type 1 [Trichoplax sp. H2]|nr:Neuropeptide Y receptor type 1 [Trichoplax sp. H2]|eukprot:RDD43220.1 Neuropeptide Y receptor type 1 [Trichoplax sp. H2]